MEPARFRPEQMPHPCQLDSEALLAELARIRDLALRIPATRNELIGPTNTVIDAIWDLEERLRFCYHLHCEKQRQFLRHATEALYLYMSSEQITEEAAATTQTRKR
jgi:hypothetical protein